MASLYSSSSSSWNSGYYRTRLALFMLLFGTCFAQLSTNFYATTCPLALVTIRSQVLAAVSKEARMGALLLRLHFHDCFVQGCDGSVLLDDTATFTGEKTADANVNSSKEFKVIDQIKSAVEFVCPGVVSCADIVAVAARDSTVALGGPSWNVILGRRDSTTASLSAANTDLPLPSYNLSQLIATFAKKGFTPRETMALSAFLTNVCPVGDGDSNLQPLDFVSPSFFDDACFRNLVNQKGKPLLFRSEVAKAMEKMSEITPLTGSDGQIRHNCRKLN